MTHTSILFKTNSTNTAQEYLAKGWKPNGEFVKMTLTEERIQELQLVGYEFYSIYPID